jgi:hypothetical protein
MLMATNVLEHGASDAFSRETFPLPDAISKREGFAIK